MGVDMEEKDNNVEAAVAQKDNSVEETSSYFGSLSNGASYLASSVITWFLPSSEFAKDKINEAGDVYSNELIDWINNKDKVVQVLEEVAPVLEEKQPDVSQFSIKNSAQNAAIYAATGVKDAAIYAATGAKNAVVNEDYHPALAVAGIATKGVYDAAKSVFVAANDLSMCQNELPAVIAKGVENAKIADLIGVDKNVLDRAIKAVPTTPYEFAKLVTKEVARKCAPKIANLAKDMAQKKIKDETEKLLKGYINDDPDAVSKVNSIIDTAGKGLELATESLNNLNDWWNQPGDSIGKILNDWLDQPGVDIGKIAREGGAALAVAQFIECASVVTHSADQYNSSKAKIKELESSKGSDNTVSVWVSNKTNDKSQEYHGNMSMLQVTTGVNAIAERLYESKTLDQLLADNSKLDKVARSSVDMFTHVSKGQVARTKIEEKDFEAQARENGYQKAIEHFKDNEQSQKNVTDKYQEDTNKLGGFCWKLHLNMVVGYACSAKDLVDVIGHCSENESDIIGEESEMVA